MDEFRTALGQYLVGSLDVAGLEQAADRALNSQEEAAPQLIEMLDDLHQDGRLTDQIYALLNRHIQTHVQQAIERSSGELPPAESDSDLDDATRIAPPPDASGTPKTDPSGSGTSKSSDWSHPSEWSGTGDGPSQPIAIGSVIKERYVLESLLGQGGMGRVFKARDVRKEEAQDRNPYVAIKILNEDFKRHPKSLQALQRESRKAQDLAHPNIVNVFDFDRDGDNVFMTMEPLKGEALNDLNKRHALRGIPVDRALGIIQDLSDGLAYAHKKGIVHSDFKPANAFLTDAGIVKILDFGIARTGQIEADDGGEKTLFDAGELGALTPAYASCEMIEGGEPDQRDDIYALAVVAYELMAGKHPFDKKSAANARNAGMVPVRIKSLNRRQWRAIRHGLAFARKDRTPSVDDFMAELGPRGFPVALAASVGVVAIAVVAAVPLVTSYLDDAKVARLATTIEGGSDAAITNSLEELTELREVEGDLFRSVFSGDATREKFVAYYSRRVRTVWDPPAERFDYLGASALIAELANALRDSRSVGVLEDLIQEEKDNEIADLYNDLDRLREEGLLIPQQSEQNVVGVLNVIRQIDPNDPKLKDAAIPIRFAEVGRTTLDSGQIELASNIVEQGLILTPDDGSLIDVGDRVRNERNRFSRDARIAELAQTLSETLALPSDLDGLLRHKAEIQELALLDEANVTLQRVRADAHRLVATEVDAALGSEGYTAGLERIADFDGLAAASFLAEQRGRIESATGELSTENQQQIALAQQQRKQDIDGNLERLIGLASFDQAWNEEVRGVLVEYASLVGEGSEELSDKNRRVAELYVDDAERLRLAQRFENAGRQLDRATRYAPDLASLATEREALGRNQLALEESVRQRTLEAEIEGLKLNLRAEAARGDVAKANEILDELKAQVPDDRFVAEEGPQLIAASYVELAGKESQAGRFGSAREYVALAESAAPGFVDVNALSAEIDAMEKLATASVDPCADPNLIGNGSNRRFFCRDSLSETKNGPNLVVIPGGGPFAQPVAISKYEIRIGDYNTYCELSGTCTNKSGDPRLPLTEVSIQQAQAYVDWLAESSGAAYRLPDALEWEYAANAGGQQPPKNFNCQVRQNNVLIKGIELMPVNTGDANGWGLVNYVGNAQEWVRAGSGWEARGGAYTNSMNQCDIKMSSTHDGQADSVTGFRVLRELG